MQVDARTAITAALAADAAEELRDANQTNQNSQNNPAVLRTQLRAAEVQIVQLRQRVEALSEVQRSLRADQPRANHAALLPLVDGGVPGVVVSQQVRFTPSCTMMWKLRIGTYPHLSSEMADFIEISIS